MAAFFAYFIEAKTIEEFSVARAMWWEQMCAFARQSGCGYKQFNAVAMRLTHVAALVEDRERNWERVFKKKATR